MFYVKVDDQVLTLNARCQTVVLTNYIRTALSIPATQAIDLLPQAQPDAKPNAGPQPLGLADRGEQTYANTYLAQRGTYGLLFVSEDEDGIKEYKVRWRAATGDEHDKMQALLDARTADERKKAAAAKGKGKK